MPFQLLLISMLLSPVDGLKFDLRLEQASRFAGSPVSIILSIQEKEGSDDIRSVWMGNSCVRIGISDAKGKTVYESAQGSNRCGGRLDPWWKWMPEDTDVSEHLFVLNEWCSTELPPGMYNIDVSIEHVQVVTGADVKILSDGSTSTSTREYPMRMHWELPLEIVGENDDVVKAEYLALLEAAKNRSTELSHKRERALDLLAYSKEMLALPYQLELFLQQETLIERNTGFEENCLYYDLPMRFIESNSPIAASALVDFLRPMDKTKEEMIVLVQSDHMAHIVLWTVFELHEQGNPKVVTITEPVVQRHERPRDPRPVPGLD